MRTGIVYTETVIYSAPETFAKEAPYQTAIIALDSGSGTGRLTARILGDRVAIGDRVVELAPGEWLHNALPPGAPMTNVPFFRKA